jgi:hypothetical protein
VTEPPREADVARRTVDRRGHGVANFHVAPADRTESGMRPPTTTIVRKFLGLAHRHEGLSEFIQAYTDTDLRFRLRGSL